ncbi:arylamine N-acetyltransferase [Novosphingobium bradum]|uniref:Arylamine N-acetyltransferase n=1 Tax=Novosphingobium bradum TaxID=1737444 RepID=A0ABV7IVH4_9SPHN
MTDAALAAYLARLGLDRPPPRDAAGLAQLQAAQRQAIAFENLDVRLGRPIRIDGASVLAKLVHSRRGGYCFEQNRLYADMLGLLGFASRPLLARPRLAIPAGTVPPRTHVLLLVDLGGSPWICDAGFGGSYVPPLPLVDGAGAQTPDGARHRLRRVGAPGSLAGEWQLERAGATAATDGRFAAHDGWQAQYTFDLAEVAADDLEQANWWTSTWPASRFVQADVISRVLPDGFAAMNGGALAITRAGRTERRTITDAADYRAALDAVFGIDLPEAALR